ncbi:ABC transporter substrate-binding protein [Labilibaculum sp. K2S]|uniref:ABC transporter substrate-binding protein n=1 Tax=Labilibaculum sp. K2S TaxID=3056386 RepID=UPI0025A4BC06|nr:ABC transporter substrate-binding protein [Labilibaculum sp. K2S]MDM8158575.1 ABC transporter substrate-binding protein [Labilibaculum sp. K2S]
MIDIKTKIKQILQQTPGCEEFLYPFLHKIQDDTSLISLATMLDIPASILQYGLERSIKREEQNSCNYQQMRERLIKPGHVNIAGFVNFLWQNEFVYEMKSKSEKSGIKLNLNIFPKHSIEQFQNYISLCTSPDDLPEILIGKGFSSFMSQRFVDKFVKTGSYSHPPVSDKTGRVFAKARLQDSQHDYHPFGVEEMVMIHDKTIPFSEELPKTWISVLEPKYANAIMQMGKAKRDHFGFNMMLYLYTKVGREGIEQYASNVKNKQHFSYIIKNMARNNGDSAPINIVHQFAGRFIRSDALEKTEVITTKDGNPCVCIFFLMKNSLCDHGIEMARHLYSPQIKSIMEKWGTAHITSELPTSGNPKIQWVGWNKIKELPLPYLKEELSETAYNHYKKAEL